MAVATLVDRRRNNFVTTGKEERTTTFSFLWLTPHMIPTFLVITGTAGLIGGEVPGKDGYFFDKDCVVFTNKPSSAPTKVPNAAPPITNLAVTIGGTYIQ